LSDNRHGLIVSAVVTTSDGYAEREAANAMIADSRQVADETAEITLGADKGYDAGEFIEALIELNVIPHAAQNTSHRRSAVPDGIADGDGYATIVIRFDQDYGDLARWIGFKKHCGICQRNMPPHVISPRCSDRSHFSVLIGIKNAALPVIYTPAEFLKLSDMSHSPDHTDVPDSGHNLSTVVVRYILPYNTLLAFAAALAGFAGWVSPWLLAGFALTLQALMVIALMLDGAFRYELVGVGRRGAQKNKRTGHFIRFLWPSEQARLYKTGPFWALAVITVGISAYAAHQWHLEIDRIAAKKAELAAKKASRQSEVITEWGAVGNPALNIPDSTAHIRSGSIVRREEYGVLRFTVADALVKDFIVADAFLDNLSGIKSAEVIAEIQCEEGGLIRELSVTTYPEYNWAGHAHTIPAMELYWRTINEKNGRRGSLDHAIEELVCRYHRPGEPMD
jgi:hypothetical protein